jgi:hypothetical protein
MRHRGRGRALKRRYGRAYDLYVGDDGKIHGSGG